MRAPFLFPILVIAAAVLLIAGYDGLLWWRGGAQATISIHLWNATHDRPIIAFVLGTIFAGTIGVVAGHVFWPLD